jgi:dipeptidyl aminopeptidase/acylaminoacyl peptidase
MSAAGRGLSHRSVRLAIVAVLALLPFSLLAGQGPVRSSLPPGSAVAVPFEGPGWQDKVLTHEGYVAPPRELADAVLAPREMNVTLGNPSPDKKWFLDEIGDGPTPMAIFGRPFDELGGVFIDFKANRQRAMSRRNTIGLQLFSTADGSRKALATPPGLRVTNSRWTPDGAGVIYMTLNDDGTHVWMTDVATNKPRQVTKTSLLTTFVTNFAFVNNGKQIVAVFPPDGRTARPLPPAVPTGPEVRVSMDADRNRLRTYPSLMQTPYDYQLLEWHATGQIGIVDVATGAMTKFGKPEMITAVDMSPQGTHARVTRMTKPFSYIVPTSQFGSIQEIWDSTGKALAKLSERQLNLGVQDDTPDPVPDPTQQPTQQPDPQPAQGRGGRGGGGGGPDNGKRDVTWRVDGPGFTYLQLEPPPPGSENAGRGGRAGGAGAGGGTGGGRAGQGGGGGQQGGGAQQAGGRGAQPQGPPRKDRLMHWLPPFGDTDTKLIYEHDRPLTGVRFSPDGKIMFFTQENRTWAMYLSDTTQKYPLTQATGGGNRGGGQGGDTAAGGAPTQQAAGGGAGGQGAGGGSQGTLVGAGGGGGGGGGRGGGGGGRGGGGGGGGGPVLVSPDGTSVYFQGSRGGGRGANATPARPFVEKVDIKTGARTLVFEGQTTTIPETISVLLDPEAKRVVLSRQNATTPPQQFIWDNGTTKQLTNNEDLFPDLTKMITQRFTVTRADGFVFRTVVYLPAGYQQNTRLPGFFWFYPREYTSQEAYDGGGRGGGGGGGGGAANQNFPSFGTLSKQFLVRLGYVVIENDSPIVGPTGEMNNNYVNDLRNNLAATIDELDKRGLIDRHRLAIGGHSYGAFSTVNAMVHTPFFKAGIAGDGAYNRTLTPLGFQTERRDLWQAPQVYLGMSPFLHANNLTGALLMYHGMHDQNVGTDPVNSIRLFHALNGLGKTVALYEYPFEDHGPASRETLLDLWARWAAWLDKYVKNPQPLTRPAPAPNAGAGRGGGQ